MSIDIVGRLLKVESQVQKIICKDLNTEIKHTFLISESAYDPDNPLDGWDSPKKPVIKDTVSVLFSDNTIVNYTFVNGESDHWEVTYINPAIPIEVDEDNVIYFEESDFEYGDGFYPVSLGIDGDKCILKSKDNIFGYFHFEDENNWVLDFYDLSNISNKTTVTSDDDSVNITEVIDDNNNIIYNLSVPIQSDLQTKTVYVEATNGNDTTGLRGYRHFPFKTLNAALAVLQDGDTLYVFPGDYFSSVTVTKYFNIYCENGVNWDLRARFNPSSGITNTTTKLNWRFDNLYGTALYPAFIGGINYVNISFNNYEYTKGLAPGFSDMSINIKTFKNAYLYLNSNDATEASKYICNININNMFVDQRPISNCPINIAQIREKTKININIDNVKIIGDLGGDNGVINLGAPGDGSPYRDIVAKINNCDFYPTAVYSTTPAPFDNRNAWRNAWPSQTGNGIFWIRQAWTNGSNINFELKNYRGTGWGAYINLWNYDFPATSPTIQRIINVKLQGYWEKSAPVSIGGWGDLTGVNQPLNTIVNVELDVICDTAPGVMFFWYGSHPSNRFNISGKIVTKSAGMPCITLNNAFNIQTPTDGNFNSNGTITLKDLMLINDGTVAPIMINPLNAQVQEVMIQNVKSNSLVVDANITEIGESITRNIKYK